jgi:hypothetical protein
MKTVLQEALINLDKLLIFKKKIKKRGLIYFVLFWHIERKSLASLNRFHNETNRKIFYSKECYFFFSKIGYIISETLFYQFLALKF